MRSARSGGEEGAARPSSFPPPTAVRSRSPRVSTAGRSLFPALSTGIYGYPAELAAPVAVAAVRELEERFDEIRFVFLEDGAREVFAGVD
jgi:hypothetical protein